MNCNDHEVFEKQSEPHRRGLARLGAAQHEMQSQCITVPSNKRLAARTAARSTEISILAGCRWKIKKWILSRRCEKTWASCR
jgi:hypothetical protein